ACSEGNAEPDQARRVGIGLRVGMGRGRLQEILNRSGVRRLAGRGGRAVVYPALATGRTECVGEDVKEPPGWRICITTMRRPLGRTWRASARSRSTSRICFA